MEAIDRASQLIRQRLKELEAEKRQLTEALRSLQDRREPSSRRNGSGRRAKTGARTSTRRRGRRAARGERQDQFLADVKAHPGARMSEVAKRIGVQPQQLYPIARRLTSEGAIAKSGVGYALAADGARS